MYYNGRQFSDFKGINLKAANGCLRLENADTSPTSTSGELLVYASGGVLYFDNGSSAVAIGAAGSSGQSLDTGYDNGRTITVNNGAVTLNGVNQDTAVLALTGDGDSAGALITFSHTTNTRKDIDGTGSAWFVTGAGNATFNQVATPTIVSATSGNTALTIDAAGTGTIGIGATSTGAVTITPALTATASITITGAEGSAKLTVTAGDVVVSDGSLDITDDDNAASLAVTNATATTIGAAAAGGVVQIDAAGLTTGALLSLELTEGTLNGGWYLRAWDVTAAAAVFTVGENGDVAITGTADADALLISNGDLTMSDGKIAVTNADNENTILVTNNGLTTAAAGKFVGSGAFTGTTTSSFFQITPTGLTTGTALYIAGAAATTASTLVDVTTSTTTGTALRLTTTGTQTGVGSALEVVADSATTPGASAGEGVVKVSADGLTTGTALDVTSTSIVITSGRIADFSHISGNITGTLDKTGDYFNVSSFRTVTTGTVADDYDMANFIRTSVINGGGSFTATGSVLYVENAVTNTSGTVTDTVNGIQIVMDSLGTGTGISLTHASASATGILVTNNSLTTGIGVSIADSGTGMTSGSLLRVSTASTGAVATNGVVSVRATGAYTSTSNVGLVDILASGTTAGTVVRIAASAAGQTATELLRVVASGYTTGYTGNVANFIGVSTTGASNVVAISSANSTAGTALSITANSLTTGSAVLVTSSGTITSAGEGLVNLVGTGITTGDALKIDLTEATLNGGNYINCYDDTATATVFKVAEDGATTIAGSAGNTAALTITAGDILMSAGVFRGAVTATITADVGSAQGGNPITRSFNEIAVCATGGDSITLPAAAAGQFILITNHGAASADVFPASGDAINEAAANSAKALAADASMLCYSYDGTNWECLTLAR